MNEAPGYRKSSIAFWPTRDGMMQMLADTGFSQAVMIGPEYMVRYGARRWVVASKGAPLDLGAINQAFEKPLEAFPPPA